MTKGLKNVYQIKWAIFANLLKDRAVASITSKINFFYLAADHPSAP